MMSNHAKIVESYPSNCCFVPRVLVPTGHTILAPLVFLDHTTLTSGPWTGEQNRYNSENKLHVTEHFTLCPPYIPCDVTGVTQLVLPSPSTAFTATSLQLPR